MILCDLFGMVKWPFKWFFATSNPRIFFQINLSHQQPSPLHIPPRSTVYYLEPEDLNQAFCEGGSGSCFLTPKKNPWSDKNSCLFFSKFFFVCPYKLTTWGHDPVWFIFFDFLGDFNHHKLLHSFTFLRRRNVWLVNLLPANIPPFRNKGGGRLTSHDWHPDWDMIAICLRHVPPRSNKHGCKRGPWMRRFFKFPDLNTWRISSQL